MLRYFGFEVKNYDFTLRRLAYESLQLVQNPGKTLAAKFISIRGVAAT